MAALDVTGFGSLGTENPFHQADFFRALDYQLKQEIQSQLKGMRGEEDEHAYHVSIRFDRDYNSLNPKFYWTIQIRKQKYKEYAWDDETVGVYTFTLTSKRAFTHDAKLKDLVIEFSDLLDNIAEKQLLAEELFENFDLHLNEDMEGVDIEVKNEENGQIKYKITRTPRYYKIAEESIKTSNLYRVSATNTKDDIVSLIADDWMTLEEIKTTLSLVL